VRRSHGKQCARLNYAGTAYACIAKNTSTGNAAARIRRTEFFGEAHRFQTLQRPRVQSSPRPVRPMQFTTLGLQDAQNAVANTLRAAHRQLLQARFGIEIPLSVPYGPNMTCPPSSPFTDTNVANITTTLQRTVREVARELHNAPGVLHCNVTIRCIRSRR